MKLENRNTKEKINKTKTCLQKFDKILGRITKMKREEIQFIVIESEKMRPPHQHYRN